MTEPLKLHDANEGVLIIERVSAAPADGELIKLRIPSTVGNPHGEFFTTPEQWARVTQGEWLPIESAPKGQKVFAGYFNALGKWRTVMARYYESDTLEWHDQSPNYGEGFAPEGWYEESETHEDILPLDPEPTHFRYLFAPPSTALGEKK